MLINNYRRRILSEELAPVEIIDFADPRIRPGTLRIPFLLIFLVSGA
jgi:hypothetical protein